MLTDDQRARLEAITAAASNGSAPSEQTCIVTIQEFTAVEEAGADPLLGEPGQAPIPEGGDVMLYGDGGASKTTLGIDLAFHLAAGDPWLGIAVPNAVRVMVIEAEGPRPLFRDKLRRKLESWTGSPIGDRLVILEKPWAAFRLPDDVEIADLIGEYEIDVLIVGPLTRVGMDELGTLQQVRDFMAGVEQFRARSGRRLTVILVHHENKGGTVSGAWEGAGDTLLHAQVFTRGRTSLTFQKARWSSRWHKEKLELDWTDGEGFKPVEDPERDLKAEIKDWLLANPHSTVKEIARVKKVRREDGTEESIPGIGARDDAIDDILNTNLDLFRLRIKEAAKEVGRSPSARVWEVKSDES